MAPLNRQKLLILAASPIGNLGDASPRLREALGRADVIFAEDTRRGRSLLSALEIPSQASWVRWDAHREAKQGPGLPVEWSGAVALCLTDAGSPGVSDPGLGLVRRAHEHDIRVEVIPGPSAVTAAIGLAGLGSGAGYTFVGFAPRKPKERQKFVANWKRALALGWAEGPVVGFESPERIEGWLESLSELCPSLNLAVMKELTKIHERVWRGSPSEVLKALRKCEGEDSKIWNGEWVWVGHLEREALERDELETLKSPSESSDWESVLLQRLERGDELKRVSEEISHEFGVRKRDVYQRGISLKKLKK
jgi:16S rRNA (cytidine1402-2'-O)-methyltransferase